MISICNHIKLDPSYWKIDKNNIFTIDLCNNETEFFIVDPNRIYSLGGNKSSILDPVLIKTNLSYVTDSKWSQICLGFQNSIWENKGWSANNEDLLFTEIKNWIINNFNNDTSNVSLDDFNLITVRGAFNSNFYTVAFCYPGSN